MIDLGFTTVVSDYTPSFVTCHPQKTTEHMPPVTQDANNDPRLLGGFNLEREKATHDSPARVL